MRNASGRRLSTSALNDPIVELAQHMALMAVPDKYVSLTNIDPAEATKYGNRLLAEYHNAPMVLSVVAQRIHGRKDQDRGGA